MVRRKQPDTGKNTPEHPGYRPGSHKRLNHAAEPGSFPSPRGPRKLGERLSDKHVARLVQATALAAGVRGDLPEGERRLKFAGPSLRAGLATAEMTRRYQCRRDRFRVNLTKAAGL
jgi:hypothetical protein